MAKDSTDTLRDVGSSRSTADNVSATVIDLPLRHNSGITAEPTRTPETPTVTGSIMQFHEHVSETISEAKVVPITPNHKHKISTGGYESERSLESDYIRERDEASYGMKTESSLKERVKKKRRRFYSIVFTFHLLRIG